MDKEALKALLKELFESGEIKLVVEPRVVFEGISSTLHEIRIGIIINETAVSQSYFRLNIPHTK